jgi:hypothetical protein
MYYLINLRQSKIMLAPSPPSLEKKNGEKQTDSPAPNILKISTFQEQESKQV